MKRFITVLIVLVFSMVATTDIAIAAEKIIGLIKNMDADTNTVVITDERTKEDITIIVESKEKLDKFNVDDKVEVLYETKDGKNIASSFRRYFKKRVGC